MFKAIFTITAILTFSVSTFSFAGSSRNLMDCKTTGASMSFLQESASGDPSKGAVCFITFLDGIQNLACPELTAKVDLGQSVQLTFTTSSEEFHVTIPKSLGTPGNSGTTTVTGQVLNENGVSVDVNETLNCNSHAGADLVFSLSIN